MSMPMAGQKLLVIAFIFQFSQSSTTEFSENDQFRQLSGDSTCICPDSSWSVTYECTVIGEQLLGTKWTGSAIRKLCEDTPSGILFLFRRRFELDNPTTIICDNGTIVGKGVRVDDDSFTSQLTITVSSNSSIIGDTIVCSQENLNGTTHTLGNMTIELQNSIDNTFTADKVYISAIDIGLRQLEFAWSPVAPDCPAMVRYNILASNCGSCPTTTNHNNAICTDVPVNGNTCKFVVRPEVCGAVDGISNYSLVIDSTQTFRGTHSTDVSLSLLIVGIACLAISILVIVVCCCLYKYNGIIKKRSTDSRIKSVTNDTVSLQSECNTTQMEYNRDSLEYSKLEEIPLDLKRLLMKLQGQVSKQWYQFGLALGLPMDVLEEFNHYNYSEDDCLAEVLDYWLKHHPTQPTWQEITDAQSKLETFNTPKSLGSTKRVDKKDVSDIPPPKPPRRSSSVTARNSTAPPSTGSKIECEHEYECVQ